MSSVNIAVTPFHELNTAQRVMQSCIIEKYFSDVSGATDGYCVNSDDQVFICGQQYCVKGLCICLCTRLTIRGIIYWSMKSRPSMCQLSLLPTSSSATLHRPQTSCPLRWQPSTSTLRTRTPSLSVSRYTENSLEFLTDISSSLVAFCIKIT